MNFNFSVADSRVEVIVVERNVQAIGHLIHPLALLEIDLSIEDKNYGCIKYQLDSPNTDIRFNYISEIIDTCLRKLRKSEEANIEIHSKDGAINKMKIRLVNVIHSVPLWEIGTDDRLDHAVRLKEIGSAKFKEGKNDDEAIYAYQRALFWISIVDKNESRAIRSRLRAQILANISAVHAVNKNLEKTIKTSSMALDIESTFPNILKNKNQVLLRRSDAFAKLNEFESAKADLDLIQEPSEAQQKKMKSIIFRIRTVTKQTDKQMAKGLTKLFA